MKIKLENRKGLDKMKSGAKKIQEVLDLIDGELISKQNHTLILQHYTQPYKFISTAERYGMLIRIVGQGRQPNAVWAKTHDYPEFEAPEITAEQLLQIANKGRGKGAKRQKPADDSAHAWNRSPRKPSQGKAASKDSQDKVYSSAKKGDGSTLKPQFNHAIGAPSGLKNYAATERYQPSRMHIMNEIEDLGGYQHHMHQPQSTGRVFSKGRY